MCADAAVIRCLALDFGTKRIGVAVGQSITQTATPLGLVEVKSGQVNWLTLDEHIQQWQPDVILLGLPLNKDGERQLITEQCEAFAQAFEVRYQKQVTWVDERYSSQAANTLLSDLSNRQRLKSKHKYNKDTMAAAIILESWFRA